MQMAELDGESYVIGRVTRQQIRGVPSALREEQSLMLASGKRAGDSHSLFVSGTCR